MNIDYWKRLKEKEEVLFIGENKIKIKYKTKGFF